jgi:hypothetical protein
MGMSSRMSVRADQSPPVAKWRAAQARQAAQRRSERGFTPGRAPVITTWYAGIRGRKGGPRGR